MSYEFWLLHYKTSSLLKHLRALEDGPNAWASETHVGDPDGVPKLWPGPAPALISCGHFGGEPADGRFPSSYLFFPSLPPLPLCLPFTPSPCLTLLPHHSTFEIIKSLEKNILLLFSRKKMLTQEEEYMTHSTWKRHALWESWTLHFAGEG